MKGSQGTGGGRPGKGASAHKRIVIPFEDNRILPQVLGEHDAHLTLVEDRLGVDAQAHGNVIAIQGPEDACDLARTVLEQLYTRAQRGEAITAGDFDSLIRHARQGPARAQGDGDGRAQIATRRKTVKARTPLQTEYMRAFARRGTDLVFGLGPAGTGKTFLAVAAAAQALERGEVKRIILSRPAVEAGERLGFLPGDMKEKVDPYLRPIYDALYEMLAPEKVAKDIDEDVIEIAPLAFMRGRTLSHAFIILDEAQNTTSMQMKMFLTRIGEGSKMVITGDPSQIDLPPGVRSGLDEAVGLLAGVEGVEMIRFGAGDVVRHPLVQRIVEAYERAGVTSRPATRRGTQAGS